MILITILSITNMATLAAEQENLAVFKSIQVDKGDSSLTVTLDIEGHYSYQHFELKNPARLVVEFSPIGDIRTEASQEVNTAGVKLIRTGRFQPQTARVVFDLADMLPSYEISQVSRGIQVVFHALEGMPSQAPVMEEREEPQVEEEPQPIVAEEQKAPTHLKAIGFEKINDQLHVKIDVDGDFSYKSVELSKFSTLIIDFWPIQKLSATTKSDINITGLKSIAVRKIDIETVRLILDFERWLSDFRIERVAGGVAIRFPVPEKAVTPADIARVEKKITEPFVNTVFNLSLGTYKISDEMFQEIYPGSGQIWGIEFSRMILRASNFRVDLAVAGRRYVKTGLSTVTQEETKFRITPITFGLRFFWNFKYFAPYIGGGIDIHKYKEENNLGEISGSTTGTHFQGGIYFKIPEVRFLMLNLYVKLYNATATEQDVEIDIGGTEFGVAVSLGFDVLKKAAIILD